jgi:hypothetical protein
MTRPTLEQQAANQAYVDAIRRVVAECADAIAAARQTTDQEEE